VGSTPAIRTPLPFRGPIHGSSERCVSRQESCPSQLKSRNN